MVVAAEIMASVELGNMNFCQVKVEWTAKRFVSADKYNNSNTFHTFGPDGEYAAEEEMMVLGKG